MPDSISEQVKLLTEQVKLLKEFIIKNHENRLKKLENDIGGIKKEMETMNSNIQEILRRLSPKETLPQQSVFDKF